MSFLGSIVYSPAKKQVITKKELHSSLQVVCIAWAGQVLQLEPKQNLLAWLSCRAHCCYLHTCTSLHAMYNTYQYIHTYTYVCVQKCVDIVVFMYVYIYIYMHVYIYIYIPVHMCVFMYMHTHCTRIRFSTFCIFALVAVSVSLLASTLVSTSASIPMYASLPAWIIRCMSTLEYTPFFYI